MFRWMLLAGFVTALISCKEETSYLTPSLSNISESVYASGVVRSAFQYNIMPSVAGKIEKIYVKSGDTILSGDPLFLIGNDAVRVSVELARLSSENADFKANQKKIDEAKANIDQLRRKLTLDSSLYVRQASLWSQNIGTKSEFEQRELIFEQSKTSLNAAIIQLQELERQLRFVSAQSRKNLEVSGINEKDFTVRSEVNGRIYNILKEKGEIVTPQTILGVAGSHTDFELELQVDEYDIVQIVPGLFTSVTLDSYKNELFTARVTRVDPIMDERTRTFKVYAIFDKSPAILYPNLTAEANIILRSKENVLTIPRSALLGDTAVMMADKTVRKVKTGMKDYIIAEITEGLQQGDKIIAPK